DLGPAARQVGGHDGLDCRWNRRNRSRCRDQRIPGEARRGPTGPGAGPRGEGEGHARRARESQSADGRPEDARRSPAGARDVPAGPLRHDQNLAPRRAQGACRGRREGRQHRSGGRLMYKIRETQKVALRRREGQMRNVRSTHETKWSQIREHMANDRYRPNISDENQGQRKDQGVIDNTPSKAARTLASGMAAGITPPTRPWKRIGPARQDQRDNWALKNYCYKVDQEIDRKFAIGNLYKVLPSVYYDMG